MKTIQILVLCLFVFPSIIYGQMDWKPSFQNEKIHTDYNDCAAIFFDDLMLVDKFSPEGVCKLQAGQKGFIYVATVILTEGGGGYAKEKIPFQIAIRNNRTNTMRMFSNKIYDNIYFDDILSDCEEGDEIIILTTGKKYSLSHHVIQLMMGC